MDNNIISIDALYEDRDNEDLDNLIEEGIIMTKNMIDHVRNAALDNNNVETKRRYLVKIVELNEYLLDILKVE